MVAREFTICSHWQVVHKFKDGGDGGGGGGNTTDTTKQPENKNDNEIEANLDMLPAVPMCSFLCPKVATTQGPIVLNHVCGNLLVSMYLLHPLSLSTMVSLSMSDAASPDWYPLIWVAALPKACPIRP